MATLYIDTTNSTSKPVIMCIAVQNLINYQCLIKIKNHARIKRKYFTYKPRHNVLFNIGNLPKWKKIEAYTFEPNACEVC